MELHIQLHIQTNFMDICKPLYVFVGVGKLSKQLVYAIIINMHKPS